MANSDRKQDRKTITLEPMTKAAWYRLPAIVRYFHPWERARKPLTVKRVSPPADGYRYFTEGKR